MVHQGTPILSAYSHCLGLWCVCGLSDLGGLDVLDRGGSFSSSFSGLFLSLVFGGLFGIVLCRFFFLLLLCVFLVGALAVGNLFLNRLALLMRWLGACSLVSNGTVASIIFMWEEWEVAALSSGCQSATWAVRITSGSNVQLAPGASRTLAKPWLAAKAGSCHDLLFFLFSIILFGEGDELFLVFLVTGALPGGHGVGLCV
ncbi:hypothetical protein CFAM422_007357 [Trichoderma lentiforme]|uniref:Uncharacterized protein n=1 Tax=Trichoderma lentiforme TaxID=1567552 RepID=A0A9P5CCH5_9HYPO|nr:hypothetical protein CFAM422_007357 [Trichoderma lentiforme]